jgi:pyrimidine dimer DNA glycosylase
LDERIRESEQQKGINGLMTDMNIFATSPDPTTSAQALDDLRLNKMIVESCQILSTALHITGRGTSDLYRPAYTSHPVVLWTAGDPRHYGWLFRHLEALFGERSFRTGKLEHRSLQLLPGLNLHVTTSVAPVRFENCTPYKSIDCVHLAYQMTLRHKWDHDIRRPSWSKRGPPNFWHETPISDP